MTASSLALVATLAPLAGFAIAILALRRRHTAAASVTILSGIVSAVAAVTLLSRGALEAPLTRRWFESEFASMSFGFLLDGPNLLMGVVVSVIALLIQVYSVGYMAGDRERGRYFALLALFTWTMMSLVYAANLLQLFIFWELVGLASFLLIGFWYEKPSAAAAARKAFIMTRVGDVGLFIGVILLLHHLGTLDIARLTDPAVFGVLAPATLTTIGFLVLAGVVGKSAQFPLHTWLPDAMEGPTPVSALLHSATMVAAGVFLFARLEPLVTASDTVVTWTLGIALGTAILSATIAMVVKDLKRVLAYSSISQLSFMLFGLAGGSVFAGLFHLTTHAAFKAMLFLTAGAYIHHFHTNDMIAMGRLGGRRLGTTSAALVIGAAALAGIPPFGGFFSKEAIIHALEGRPAAFTWGVYVAAFLTAYYSFRMVFLLLRPNPGGALEPDEPGHAPADFHDAPWVMRGPILGLAAVTLIVGWLGPEIEHLLSTDHGGHVARFPSLGVAGPAIAVALAGVVVAWLDFGRTGVSQTGFVARLPPLERLFRRQWLVDDLYRTVVVSAVAVVSRAAAFFEQKGLDASADRVAGGTVQSGQGAASLQTGRLQLYVAIAVVALSWLGYVLAR